MAGDYFQQLLSDLGFGAQAPEAQLPARAAALVRPPYPGEQQFFQANPHVAGMAAEDNRIAMNPGTRLSEQEQAAVRLNEYTRLFMRANPDFQPTFSLTPEQARTFAAYGPPAAQRETLLARIVSGDPSAGNVTDEQRAWAEHVKANLRAWRQP